MQHPVGFSDADKFIIKGKYVYFNSPGNSYLNKFMSSLKLEEKFKNDDDYEVLCESRATTFKNVKEQIKSNSVSKMIYEEPKQDFKFKKERKGKKINHEKRQCKNIKKNKIRQNGYSYKMYCISQHIIKPIELLEIEELEIEEYYLLNLNNDYIGYFSEDEPYYDSEPFYDSEPYYDSEEEAERQLERGRDMCMWHW